MNFWMSMIYNLISKQNAANCPAQTRISVRQLLSAAAATFTEHIGMCKGKTQVIEGC